MLKSFIVKAVSGCWLGSDISNDFGRFFWGGNDEGGRKDDDGGRRNIRNRRITSKESIGVLWEGYFIKRIFRFT